MLEAMLIGSKVARGPVPLASALRGIAPWCEGEWSPHRDASWTGHPCQLRIRRPRAWGTRARARKVAVSIGRDSQSLYAIIERMFYCVKEILRRYRKWGCPASTPLPAAPHSRRHIRSQPKALPSEKLGTSTPDDHNWPPSQRFRFLSVIGIYSRDFMSSWQGLACELPSFRKPLSNCRVVQ